MNRVQIAVLQLLVFLAMADLNFVHAQPRQAPQPAAHIVEKPEWRGREAPQEFVTCTGWHALCTDSPDCRMNGDKADCDCMRVNETHIVETSAIQDTAVKRMTLAKCTLAHPCATDQAPVCKAIKDGQYDVDHRKYDWVSTYSYRGWCSLLEQKPVACDQQTPGYTGNAYWAICDAAPCTESQNPSNPDKPLRCQCRVENTPFVGLGSCTGVHGGIISSFPLSAWNFQRNTYSFPMPGYEYVQGACAPLKSDPLPLNQHLPAPSGR